MLDRLSVDVPCPPVPSRPPDFPDHPAVTGEAEKVQSRFWQHLVRLTAPARRLCRVPGCISVTPCVGR